MPKTEVQTTYSAIPVFAVTQSASLYRRPYAWVKRLMDIVLALILLIPAGGIVTLCYIFIKIETSGPAFFVQERPGYKGKLFRILKLRTMIVETERNGRELSDMERMTKVGKVVRACSFDELPQIFNILRGQMSFIGPRPLLVRYLSLYSPEQMRRHDVLPGVSGWAQVNGRNELSWEQKFERDVWYVDHMGFPLDVKILFMTIKNVLKHQGINAGVNDTMQVFQGNQTAVVGRSFEATKESNQMKESRILLTSVGRRVELVQAFKSAAEKLGIILTLYGADLSDTAPALYFCDKQVKTPRISDPTYVSELRAVCMREKIDCLIPTIDTDLLVLAHNRDKFKAFGTQVLISDEDKIRICRDKRLTSSFFIECGLLTPMPVDDVEKYCSGFPAFIKPKDGSSSIDAFRVDDQTELEMRASKVFDYIIQPFIEGTEYTVDIFCDLDGKPISITPRERIAVRSGEVLKTQIRQDATIISECQKIVDKFKPCGPMTVQLIRQKDTGKDFYIEINPRFGGGAPLSIKAGADSAEALLRLLNREKLNYNPSAAIDGMVYSRYDQSVCTSPTITSKNPLPLEAVIFDLDDTLYSEKDYVRSGFLAVAEKLDGLVEQAFDKLWAAFEAGKPAIDAVLLEAGREDLRNECLDVYRNHRPQIELYSGVYRMLVSLRNSGLKLGIITDGRPEGQKAKIETLGLASLVDYIIITDELGGLEFRKPCDISFRIMQRKLAVPFDRMIYVADNPVKDFDAPKRLGMQNLWFRNKDGLYLNGCYTNDMSIFTKLSNVFKCDSLSEIEAIVNKGGSYGL